MSGASATPHPDPPLFVIRHALEIEGSAEATWGVLSDLARYPEWNPYVLALEGELAPGSTLRVTISQENWPEPLVVEPTVVVAEPGRVLHWRGRLGDSGLLDTDHVFAIQPLDATRIRFDHFEEFRGRLAEKMDEEMRGFTRRAFQAMNEALAERVRALS
ncbi:MAG: SRPBCC domain-containing protein [Myxococcota bacterium]|nr:SRPBCC domain-containing protein [Myxococcota bacterium]